MLADTAKILFALGLPFLTGALFVAACWQTARPGYRLAVAGMAFPLGMVSVVAGYIVLDRLGVGLHFGWNAATQAVLAAGFGLLAWRRRQPATPADARCPVDDWPSLTYGARLLVVGLLIWLGIRWVGVVVEVLHRPLFPWDAWYAYGHHAKVWFFHPRLDVFANGWRWFQSAESAWSSGGLRHPPGIGLAQLWQAQALGRWDDALMNLGWPLAGASAGLVLAGSVRLARGSLALSVLTAALLLTLPIWNVQMLLAGYGDLWVGLLLLIAVAAVGLARKLEQPLLLAVGLVAIAGTLMFKQTSLLWVPLVALGALCAWVRLRWVVLVGVVTGLVAGLGTVLFLWRQQETIRLSTLGKFGFDANGLVWPHRITRETWREVVMWPDLLRHLFLYDNWHFFWYLMPAVAVLGLWLGWRDRALLGVWVAVSLCFVVLVSAFSITSLGNSVIDGTSVNRLMLHLVPAMAVLAGLVAVRMERAGWSLRRASA